MSHAAAPKVTTQLRRRLTIARSACDVVANDAARSAQSLAMNSRPDPKVHDVVLGVQGLPMTVLGVLQRLVPLVAALLVACASAPPPPDWQLDAQGAIERAQEAYLSGNGAVETLEFARAREAIRRTGRADLLARAELVRCATRVASLVLESCEGYAALEPDAAAPERAYARYLAGQADAADVALLPVQHRAGAQARAGGAAVAAIADPLARLVAAGVQLRRGRADPVTITSAIDAASAQGWRRPLLAWLGVQAYRAEQADDRIALAQIRRRIALVGGDAPR